MYGPGVSDADDIRAYTNAGHFDREDNMNERIPELDGTDSEEEYLTNLKFPMSKDDMRDNILEEELSRAMYRQSERGALADPPPLEIPSLRAEVLRYPNYQLMSLAQRYNTNKRDTFLPPKDYDAFIFKRRRRR